MYIERDRYLQRLVDRMGNGQIKVVTGIRRCGKSFLVFRLFREYLRERGVPDDHVIETCETTRRCATWATCPGT